MADAKVIDVRTSEEIQTYMNASDPLVIDWYADWCPPCKTIEPLFKELGTKYSDYGLFVRCDIDKAELKDVMDVHKISCVPTFMAYQGGALTDRFSGGDREKLTEMAKKTLRIG